MSKEKYCTLTQACASLKVKPHVLRYWEQEFDIKIKRNSAGRRIYSTSQVDKLRTIKRLLHDEKLTVRGAQQRLRTSQASVDHAQTSAMSGNGLTWMREELEQVQLLLGS
jgi:DNA-binding transcriptional MerR regulator